MLGKHTSEKHSCPPHRRPHLLCHCLPCACHTRRPAGEPLFDLHKGALQGGMALSLWIVLQELGSFVGITKRHLLWVYTHPPGKDCLPPSAGSSLMIKLDFCPTHPSAGLCVGHKEQLRHLGVRELPGCL